MSKAIARIYVLGLSVLLPTILVAALIDANGNVNTSTVAHNIFDESDAHGDGTPTHTTATPMGANETRNVQPNGTPKIVLAAATRDNIGGPLSTSQSGGANESHVAQSDGTEISASDDATPNIAGSWFTPGNLVVSVAGCGVYGGTPPNATPSTATCATPQSEGPAHHGDRP